MNHEALVQTMRRRAADRAIERYEDPDTIEEAQTKKDQIMLNGVCPYCKDEPAPRFGEPCAACRDQLEDEMNEAEAVRLINRLEHKFSHQAARRV